MEFKYVKIIVFVVLGIITVVMLFLAAFRFFAPGRGISDETAEEGTIINDPASNIYVSEDSGATWRGLAGGQFSVFHLQFDVAGSRLLVGTQEHGLWYAKSDDLKKLTPLADDKNIVPADATIFAIARSARSPVMYVALRYNDRGYVYALTDFRFTELFFAPLEDTPVRTLVLDPFRADRIFAGAGMGLYASDDDGKTWRILYRFRREIASIIANPQISGMYVVSTRAGDMFRTADHGETWEDITKSISKFKGSRANQHAFIDVSTGALYLTSDHGLIVSSDNGDTWEDIPLIVPPDSLPLIGFAVHPMQGNVLYVSAASQLYKSENGGRTWSGMQFPDKGSITAIAIHPTRPNVIVIGFADSGVSGRFGF